MMLFGYSFSTRTTHQATSVVDVRELLRPVERFPSAVSHPLYNSSASWRWRHWFLYPKPLQLQSNPFPSLSVTV